MDCIGSLFVEKNIEKQFELFRRLKVQNIVGQEHGHMEGNSRLVENNMNESMSLLPGTDDEDDRTTISSRSSLSTSTSGSYTAKLKRIV